MRTIGHWVLGAVAVLALSCEVGCAPQKPPQAVANEAALKETGEAAAAIGSAASLYANSAASAAKERLKAEICKP